MVKAKSFSILMVLALVLSLGAVIMTQRQALAQPPQDWAKTYGGNNEDKGYAVQQTSDGGYIVAGSTESFGAGGSDFWVFKLKTNGDVEWQKTYGGTEHDRARAIQETSDGYIVAGSTYSFSQGEDDFWVLKLKPDGEVEWQKSYGGRDRDFCTSLQKSSDGGYIVAGCTQTFGGGGGNFWVLKLDSSGAVTWEKTYGGTNFDSAYSIQETTDGYVVAGRTHLFGTGGDMWLLKLDKDGNVNWQKTYGGTDWDSANSVRQTSDGYIVAGATVSFGAGSANFWVLKLDTSGNVVWQKTYGGSDSDQATSIQQSSDGGYIVTGSTESFGAGDKDFWVLKLDSGGNVNWQKTYGGSEWEQAWSIQQDSDGGYVVAGSTESFGVGNYDFWILKLNEGGSIPECPLGVDSAASITTSNVTASNTDISGANSTAVVDSTNVTPSDSHCTIETQCSTPPPVGGEAYPINRLGLLAPWIAVVMAIIAGTAIFIKRSRVQI